jgi:hypothetical protein
MSKIQRNHEPPRQTTGHASNLSAVQCASILELGSRGSGGEFDSKIMSELLTMGLVAVRSSDRRLVLTESGLRIYRALLNDS